MSSKYINESLDPFYYHKKKGNLLNSDGTPFATEKGEWLLDFNDAQKNILTKCFQYRWPFYIMAYPEINAEFMTAFASRAWGIRHSYAEDVPLWKIANSNLTIPQMECAVDVLYDFGHEMVEMFPHLKDRDVQFWSLIEYGIACYIDTAGMIFNGVPYDKIRQEINKKIAREESVSENEIINRIQRHSDNLPRIMNENTNIFVKNASIDDHAGEFLPEKENISDFNGVKMYDADEFEDVVAKNIIAEFPDDEPINEPIEAFRASNNTDIINPRNAIARTNVRKGVFVKNKPIESDVTENHGGRETMLDRDMERRQKEREQKLKELGL